MEGRKGRKGRKRLKDLRDGPKDKSQRASFVPAASLCVSIVPCVLYVSCPLAGPC